MILEGGGAINLFFILTDSNWNSLYVVANRVLKCSHIHLSMVLMLMGDIHKVTDCCLAAVEDDSHSKPENEISVDIWICLRSAFEGIPPGTASHAER